MNDISDIGKQLVEHSLEADAFSAHRGMMDELFPFIFEASKRMSLRAIGRWLQSEHKISVSPNTLARAMRNAEKYWIQILEELEPSVRIVARAHDASPTHVLSSPDVIWSLEAETPTLTEVGEDIGDSYWDYKNAMTAIKVFWSQMPPAALAECLCYVGKVIEDGNDKGTDEEGEKHEGTDERKDG